MVYYHQMKIIFANFLIKKKDQGEFIISISDCKWGIIEAFL